MSASNSMEEYYQKVIQLQEKLRQSEEERLKLEIKFNEMLQVMKEEEEAHFKKLRTKYKQFLEEDRRRQQRNDKILETLDRIENRAQIWEAKTEKFKVFRRKYQDYLKHASGQRSRSPLDVERPIGPKNDLYDRETLLTDKNPKTDSEDAKNDIMEKYLQSLSSPKCKEDILQRKNEKPSLESKYSNLGNINSIYWKTPRSSEKVDPEKENKFDSTQLKNTKDLENALKQNSNAPASLSKDYGYSGLGEGGNKYSEEDYDDFLSFGRKPYDDFSSLDKKPLTEPHTGEYDFSLNKSKPVDDKIARKTSQQLTGAEEQKREFIRQPEQPPQAQQVHNNLEKLIEQHKNEAQSLSYQTIKNEPLQKSYSINLQSAQGDQFQSVPEQQIHAIPKEQSQPSSKKQIQPLPRESVQPIQPMQPVSRKILPNSVSGESFDIRKSLDQPLRQFEKFGDALKNDQDLFKYQEVSDPQILSNQPLQRPRENDLQMNLQAQTQRRPSEVLKSDIDNTQPLNQKEFSVVPDKLESINDAEEKVPNVDDTQNGQLQQLSGKTEQPALSLQQQSSYQLSEKQYDFGEQQHSANGQSLQQYDANGQPRQYDTDGQQYYDRNERLLKQYDENGQQLQQYEETGQPLQQYDGTSQSLQQYDENEQPLPQYDENGQPLQQYDENGQPMQQYDENGQPLPQYDENGQLIQPYYNENGQLQSQYYDENGRLLQKYDENGQPLQQYYDNEQTLQQYDENGQLVPQYDADGQLMPQYDENGQPIPQYGASAQPLSQYDENGQSLGQYDPNAQVQYDENGQPLIQYDENGQPIAQYVQSGQPLFQYDENGQLLTQYDENGQPLQYYDENGQPVQYYEEAEPIQQSDENGQLIQQQYSEQPYEDQQRYYEEQQDIEEPQQVQQEGQQQAQPEIETKLNVLDILETDTESAKQDTKISNDSDFDFSNG